MLVQTLVSFLSTFKNTAHKSVFRTDSELWRVENSYLRMRGSSDAQKGAACS